MTMQALPGEKCARLQPRCAELALDTLDELARATTWVGNCVLQPPRHAELARACAKLLGRRAVTMRRSWCKHSSAWPWQTAGTLEEEL